MPSLMPGEVDVLIVAAHAPNLASLRAQLGDELSGFIRKLRVAAKTVGVGGPAAAASVTRRMMQVTPTAVIQVGTAGAFPGLGFEPNDVLVTNRHVLVDAAVLDGRAAYPEPLQTIISPNAAMSDGLGADPAIRRVGVTSGSASVRDPGLANVIHDRTKCGAENLEAFSIAHACAVLQIPYACVLGVSYETTPQAKDSSAQHERSASAAACAAVSSWLHAGAPGLPHAAP
ncbi:MAG: hypothetical protein KC417_12485 [Myxococcales bacterium]|nr:hypothetical protein [Myxococcales bacterium]